MRKLSTDPRRTYTKYGILHVLWEGARYTPSAETKIDTERTLRCEALTSGDFGLIQVEQRVPGRKRVTEIWEITDLRPAQA